MTWFKVDSDFFAHHKVVGLSDAAVALWTRAGSWCSRNLTDGFVPTRALALLTTRVEQAPAELIDRGLWRRVRGGFQFHDWNEYQPTAEAELQKRRLRAEAGRKGGLASGKTRSNTGSKPEANASAKPKQTGSENEPRTRTQEKEQQTPSSSVARKRGSRIPADFAVTDAMVTWARENAPGVDGRIETANFVDYWTAAAGANATKLDWVAAWRTWLRKAQTDAGNRQARAAPRPTIPTTDRRIAEAELLKDNPDPAVLALLSPNGHRALPGGEP